MNTPKTIADDPQFRDRFRIYPHAKHGADMLPLPLKFAGETLPDPTQAPSVGEQTDVVLEELLGYDAERIAELRRSGALG